MIEANFWNKKNENNKNNYPIKKDMQILPINDYHIKVVIMEKARQK